MSEAFSDRRPNCPMQGALVFLRVAIFIVIASLSVSANPAMARFSSMPQGCMKIMMHVDAAPPAVPTVAPAQDCGLQPPHQMPCSVTGCLSADLAMNLSVAVASGVPESVAFEVKDTFAAGGFVSPGRRPPIKG